MKLLLSILLLVACGQKPEVVSENPAQDTTARFMVYDSRMYMYQDGDTVEFPLSKDYREYIFWWTVTTDREHTWDYSLLYLKKYPKKEQLMKEAKRVTDYVGLKDATIQLRDVISVDPNDPTRWDGIEEKWGTKFRNELVKH